MCIRDREEAVKKQIDYDCLMSFKDDAVVKMVEEIKDLMVDVLCGERTVISEGVPFTPRLQQISTRGGTVNNCA